jgi:translation initiation factor 1
VSRDGTVYSSQHGRVCPHCGLPTKRCACRDNPRGTAPPQPDGDGIARVRREKKGRGGKTVTTVRGVPLPPDALKALAKELRHRCGSGGSLKAGVIEIQGDHTDTVLEALTQSGFQAKRAGG